MDVEEREVSEKNKIYFLCPLSSLSLTISASVQCAHAQDCWSEAIFPGSNHSYHVRILRIPKGSEPRMGHQRGGF